jgi:ssDNA-binding Zn-finger/Zn-ribbon topoisomerase 1
MLRGLVAKSGKKFDSRARIENARLTLLFDQGGSVNPHQSAGNHGAGGNCPDCGEGKLVQRSIKSGKNEGRQYLGCTRYPRCRYFSWIAQK